MVSGIGGERKGVVSNWGRGLDVEGILARMRFQSVAKGGTVCPVYGGFPNWVAACSVRSWCNLEGSVFRMWMSFQAMFSPVVME